MSEATSGQTQVLMDVRSLTKRYGDMTAVNALSFEVRSAEIVGFLGPNGAGKTTTMRMLTTYLPPTEGRAEICGFDIVEAAAEVRKAIGYLPETPPLYNEMRIANYLAFVAELKAVPKSLRKQRVDWALEACGLADRRRQIVGTLSKGYRQRVGIAQAIIHDPKVLILDEPTSGLDPNQIIEIRKLIRQLGADRTVLLSTHILTEVASVCDRVLILHQGTLVHDAKTSDAVELERTFISLTSSEVNKEAA